MRSLFGNLHSPSSFSPLSGQAPGREARGSAVAWTLVCVIAGLLQAASLAWPLTVWAPPGLSAGEPSGWLQIGSLALLVWSLRHVHRVGQGVWRAWVFATAWLVGSFWWLFISMNTYGGLAPWLAALAVLALAGFLALYYAAAVAMLCSWAPRRRVLQAALFSALWTAAELARGQWLTGFPWGASGYAHVETLSGYAPWIGVYGMGAVAAVLAYALAVLVPGGWSAFWARMMPVRNRAMGQPQAAATPPTAMGLLVSVSGGLALAGLVAGIVFSATVGAAGRSQTEASGTLTVRLLQGNIPQDEKFVQGKGVAKALDLYRRWVMEAAAQADGPDLVVAPETSIPLLPQQLNRAYWKPFLVAVAGAGESFAVLQGLPMAEGERYMNAAMGLSASSAQQILVPLERADTGAALEAVFNSRDLGIYRYTKHHLVPFGEFIPPLFRWFTDMMNIPLGDFARGEVVQPRLLVKGERLAPNICYEDLFGEQLAASFESQDDAPTMMVNLSNIAWFGDSVAIDQHLLISRLRAMELGRPMIRATNTGATAVIDHTGAVTHRLARLQEAQLDAKVSGRVGMTPYASWSSRFGLLPVWAACASVVGLCLVLRKLPRRRQRRAS
ncbi:apolipoprotein N-acyltransferase [Hydrogenophaga sp. 5NK40-0174]|uniref:apolipoprotein N-acyltransferase n=1 Tax=Hydrogenophaga sp. 5NK40-0174 TaxID=3127649 RepID=UPI0031060143